MSILERLAAWIPGHGEKVIITAVLIGMALLVPHLWVRYLVCGEITAEKRRFARRLKKISLRCLPAKPSCRGTFQTLNIWCCPWPLGIRRWCLPQSCRKSFAAVQKVAHESRMFDNPGRDVGCKILTVH
jgi:hypothetical protein